MVLVKKHTLVQEPYYKNPSSVVSSKKVIDPVSSAVNWLKIQDPQECLQQQGVHGEDEGHALQPHVLQDGSEGDAFLLPHQGGVQPHLDVGAAFRVAAQSYRVETARLVIVFETSHELNAFVLVLKLEYMLQTVLCL